MKRFLSLVAATLFLLVSQSNAQSSPWKPQYSGLSTGTSTIGIRFAAVSNSVCWGVNTSDITAENQFIVTRDGGTTWFPSTILAAPANFRGSHVAAVDSSTAWVLMHDRTLATSGGVFKTTDGGFTWVRQAMAFPGTGGNPKIIHFFDANVGVCIGNPNPSGDWEIYRTTDGGSLWTRVHYPAQSGEGTYFIYTSSGNSLWFCGGIGFADDWRLYRTTDRGISWSMFHPGGGVSFPAFKDSVNGITARSVPTNQLLRTTDGGATWTDILISLPFSTRFTSYMPGTSSSYVMNSFAIPPLGGIQGSAFTTNDGASWTLIDNTVHRGPAAFASANAGWCGGEFDSVYKWAFPTSVRQTDEFVQDFQLEQNYPNPFNPTTNIRWQIADGRFVRLKVYDIMGREVRTLVNENLQAGSYETTFDATGLASGVYFYRLTAGDFVQTKRTLLLR